MAGGSYLVETEGTEEKKMTGKVEVMRGETNSPATATATMDYGRTAGSFLLVAYLVAVEVRKQ